MFWLWSALVALGAFLGVTSHLGGEFRSMDSKRTQWQVGLLLVIVGVAVGGCGGDLRELLP